MFGRLAHPLTMADRECAGREASPADAILGAQAARSSGVGVKGKRGYDPARRMFGRKRHALTDTDGHLLLTTVSPADWHGGHGGVALLRVSLPSPAVPGPQHRWLSLPRKTGRHSHR
jgi:hypothetical protein